MKARGAIDGTSCSDNRAEMLEALLLWLVVAFVIVLVVARGRLLRAALGVHARRREDGGDRRSQRRRGRGARLHAAGDASRRARHRRSKKRRGSSASRSIDSRKIMDSAITLPIIGRVGLDAVLDLMPVVGNFAGAAVSLTLIARTLQFGPPPSLVSKMLSNVLVDVILGGIPLVGPLADIWFKANDRNAALMSEFLQSKA